MSSNKNLRVDLVSIDKKLKEIVAEMRVTKYGGERLHIEIPKRLVQFFKKGDIVTVRKGDA